MHYLRRASGEGRVTWRRGGHVALLIFDWCKHREEGKRGTWVEGSAASVLAAGTGVAVCDDELVTHVHTNT